MTERQLDDGRWMAATVALAERGRGRTSPNPNVGCVIVRDNRVVGRGWTQPGGRPHAEAMALSQAGDASRGATLYVTLEPCAHASARGPTCVTAIIGSGVVRVVSAVEDPDPRTRGAGHAILEAAGIAVSIGTGCEAACAVMAGYLTRRLCDRPFVTLKLALSLDGCIALADGSSRWITGDAARAHAHVERARSDVILVGRGTYAADAPKLDVRVAGLENRGPLRAMLTRGDSPEGWLALNDPRALGALPGEYLLVEGGAQTAAAFVAADLVDRLLLYTAPLLIGGRSALGDIGLGSLAQAHGRWRRDDSRMLGSDRLDSYSRIRQEAACSPESSATSAR